MKNIDSGVRDLPLAHDSDIPPFSAVSAADLIRSDAGSSQHPDGRRLGRFAGVAGALILVGVVAWVLVARSGGGEPTHQGVIAVNPSVEASAQAQDVRPTCGTDLPRTVAIPPGYSGSIVGPSPDSAVPVTAGQFVEHWTSPSGSIELRWPADPDPDAPPLALNSGTIRGTVTPGNDGRQGKTMLMRVLPGESTAECQTFQLSVFAADAAQLTMTSNPIFLHPLVSPIPLVTATETAASSPPVMACNAAAGVATPPNQGGSDSGGTSAGTADDALKAFVSSRSGLIQEGYTAFQLPDGSIAYAAMGPGNRGYVTVVHVVKTGAGWSVESWGASGC